MSDADAFYDRLAEFDSPAEGDSARDMPTRGVGWVLRWAAATATLCIAAGLLTEFGYCLAAELALTRAARAGALEATLPRATYQTVASTMERRLVRFPALSDRWRFTLHHNGTPVRKALHPRPGDQLSVVLAAPIDAVLPRWLHMVRLWRGEGRIEVYAERQMPGREFMLPQR